MTRFIICMASVVCLTLISCENTPDMAVEPAGQEAFTLMKPVRTDVVALPFWARTDIIPVFDGYGVVYFYTADPANIPPDFNLLWFFDPGALAYPLAVSGFEIYGDEDDFVPRKTHLTGKGMVHFWFFPEAVINSALADYELTMPELEALDPLRGYATHFTEEMHPLGEPEFGLPGGHPHPGLKTEAKGVLENGGTFHFNMTTDIHQDQFFIHGKLTLSE